MMNPTCEQIRIAAAARDDGEAAEISDHEVNAHVEQCAACRESLASLAELQTHFDGAERIADDYDVWTSIRATLNSGNTPPAAPTRNGRYAIGIAVVALILLLAVLIPAWWNSSKPDGALDDKAPKTAGSLIPKGHEDEQPKIDGGSSTDVSKPPEASPLIVAIAPRLFDAPSVEAGAPAPYSDESYADEFALGVVKEVVERKGVKFLPLELNNVFLGRLPTGPFLAEDVHVIRVECSLPPHDLGLRSQLYKPGTNVVVYLHRDEGDRWVVSSIVPITPGQEMYWRERLQMFADIILAREAKDPEKRFHELLVMEPDGSLPNYFPIMIFPHPAARPVIRDLWRQWVKEHPVDPDNNDMKGALALIYLMRSLNEGEMLDEVLAHALRQKPGQRAAYFSELRIQSDYADADARRRLAEGLQKFLDASPALESLDSVKDLAMWSDVANARQALQYLRTRDAQRQAPK